MQARSVSIFSFLCVNIVCQWWVECISFIPRAMFDCGCWLGRILYAGTAHIWFSEVVFIVLSRFIVCLLKSHSATCGLCSYIAIAAASVPPAELAVFLTWCYLYRERRLYVNNITYIYISSTVYYQHYHQ